MIYIIRKNANSTLIVKGVEFNISSSVYEFFSTLKKTGVNNRYNIADLTYSTLITVEKYSDEFYKDCGKLIIHRLSSGNRTKEECVFNPNTGIIIFNADEGDSINIGYSKNITGLVEKEKLKDIVYETELKTDNSDVKLRVYPINKGYLLEVNNVNFYVPSYDIFSDLKNISEMSCDCTISYTLEEIDGEEKYTIEVSSMKMGLVKLALKKDNSVYIYTVFLDSTTIYNIYEYIKDAILYLSIMPNEEWCVKIKKYKRLSFILAVYIFLVYILFIWN